MQINDFWASETFLQLFVPLLGALFVTFFTWRLNRTLSQGRPMSPFAKRLLTHGFLFMLGLGLFIAWNDELAAFLRFPDREVWGPLSVGWAILLLYDASRRLKRGQQVPKPQTVEIAETTTELEETHGEENNWRANISTLLRFLVFFAIVGAIGRPGVAAFTVVGVLIVGLFSIGKLWKTSRRTDAPQ